MSTLARLVEDHDILLLDAMGVLIDKQGAVAAAPEFIAGLNRLGKTYYVLTNISGQSEEAICSRLRQAGIPLRGPDAVISAGSLVRQHLETAIPVGAMIGFIGPKTSAAVLETGRHRVASCKETAELDVLAILDDEGFDFRETLEAALTSCIRRFKRQGALPQLLLANGDRAYPKGVGDYAFGSGIFATMLSAALEDLLGKRPDVTTFGKPSERMFAEARRRGGAGSMLMIGDQIATDICGARRFGISSALVLTGLNSRQDAADARIAPDHILDDLTFSAVCSPSPLPPADTAVLRDSAAPVV
jgi:HAD superfamily hydrolase (TIGR01450 family)